MNEDQDKDLDTDLDLRILDDGAEEDFMLTTIDNPYSPKTEYVQWKRFDIENGHDTEEYIARLISMESNFDVDDEFKLNILSTKVIGDILENDTLQIYRLV